MNLKVLCLLLFILPLALAHEGEVEELHLEDLGLEGQKLPSPLHLLFGNERINIVVQFNTGLDLNASLVTKKGAILSVYENHLENPTLDVVASERAVEQMTSGEDPLQSFLDALDSGAVTYEAVGVSKKVKFSFVPLVAKVAKWFG
jgi:hypothetical protein